MKKILITGSAGFIGFHLARKLLKEKYYVKNVTEIIFVSIIKIRDIVKNATDMLYVKHQIVKQKSKKNTITIV